MHVMPDKHAISLVKIYLFRNNPLVVYKTPGVSSDDGS